ncbi:MAG TPA: 5-dehydro-4-deoxy-D-glucuronate isomerase [Anaerohalosphaeraceae bacterium]|nr:5-dehydro-4-deoxy-D-glucuronate isomerase [Anaerohalosphaeraceae bacterium]HPB93696.1 5-dehydro-4-deoxy-D-glucuronate isomerase [Anaerohalosphaeraceae bacterium]HRT24108.1 5-dehydro-4-deoxy-D-glucuronate isomerase [Anaerohalosphaeraceae bacterium]
MEIRYIPDPVCFSRMTTEEIRSNFLIDTLFKPERIELVYCDVDRVIVGSAVPTQKPLTLAAAEQLRADYFCQRRELGILNIGGGGQVKVDGKLFPMARLDCLYVGRGSRQIEFLSQNPSQPARFYLISYPAHKEYPIAHISIDKANPVPCGSLEQSNKRTIYQCIHPNGVPSCQLVMGFTRLERGSVWNTMPPHTHERRMEVYLYFDMPETDRVFHLMGKPEETRHLVVAEGQVVVSPSWSIHSGVGTAAYTFCWGMGGENQTFDDMDHLTIDQIR